MTIWTFFFYLPEKTSPDISYEASAKQTIHNSHEMSRLMFSENRKNKLRLSTKNFACVHNLRKQLFFAQVSLINETRALTPTAARSKLIDS